MSLWGFAYSSVEAWKLGSCKCLDSLTRFERSKNLKNLRNFEIYDYFFKKFDEPDKIPINVEDLIETFKQRG